MNICLITSSFPAHSDDLVQAPFLIPFLRGLQQRGHRVFVFTPDRKGKKESFLGRGSGPVVPLDGFRETPGPSQPLPTSRRSPNRKPFPLGEKRTAPFHRGEQDRCVPRALGASERGLRLSRSSAPRDPLLRLGARLGYLSIRGKSSPPRDDETDHPGSDRRFCRRV